MIIGLTGGIGSGKSVVGRMLATRFNLVENPGAIDRDGNVWPLDKPGLGLEVNEEFLLKHPPIEGPGYI